MATELHWERVHSTFHLVEGLAKALRDQSHSGRGAQTQALSTYCCRVHPTVHLPSRPVFPPSPSSPRAPHRPLNKPFASLVDCVPPRKISSFDTTISPAAPTPQPEHPHTLRSRSTPTGPGPGSVGPESDTDREEFEGIQELEAPLPLVRVVWWATVAAPRRYL